MTAERRRHHRFQIAQAIEVEFPKETIFDAQGIDVSEEGIGIQTDRDMDLYAKVFILVKTGKGENDKFYFDGIVSWIKKHGSHSQYGIRITDISHESALEMKKFIKSDSDTGKHKKA